MSDSHSSISSSSLVPSCPRAALGLGFGGGGGGSGNLGRPELEKPSLVGSNRVSMAEHQQQSGRSSSVEPAPRPPAPPPPSTSPPISSAGETTWKKIPYPNPPDAVNPDAATLRDQWRYAIRQYSRWYSQAWGTAILAGVSFFALGWFIKGYNPLSSRAHDEEEGSRDSPSPPATGQ